MTLQRLRTPTAEELAELSAMAAAQPAAAAIIAADTKLVDGIEISNVPPDKPSGKRCKSYSFTIPNLDYEFNTNPHAYDRVKTQQCDYRWCIWDGRISRAQPSGEECELCGRVVEDTYIGCLTPECLQPVRAMYVYLHQVGQWVLVAVPEATELYRASDYQ